MPSHLNYFQMFAILLNQFKGFEKSVTRVITAITIATSFNLIIFLLLPISLQLVQAKPSVQPVIEILTGTILITHTNNTTHQMGVFGNGRITNQYLNDNGLSQIGRGLDATTIAILFDQHPDDNVDVGSQGEFIATAPITLNTISQIPGYSEDSLAIYRSQTLPYEIMQRTLATTTQNCIIMEITIKNTDASNLTGGRLLYRVDIDVAQQPIDDLGFYDSSRHLVYLRDTDADEVGYAMGISLLRGELQGYGVLGNGYPTSDTNLITEMTNPTNPIIDGPNDVIWLTAGIPDLNPDQTTTLSFGWCAHTARNEEEAATKVLASFDQITKLSALKTATPLPASTVSIAEPITYSIILSNTGYYPVSNIVITDAIPAFTTLITRSINQGEIVDNNGYITATIDQLAPPDDTITVTLVVTPSALITNSIVISNQAFISGDPHVTQTNVITHQVIDDISPTLSINDITLTEGVNSLARFVVTLSKPSFETITVNYETVNGTAQAPDDYTSIPTTLLTFSPGITSQLIDVAILDDAIDEDNENFFINLTTPSNVILEDNQAEATIIDNDSKPTLSISDTTIMEGNSGFSNAVFTVTLSAPSAKTITVEYSTADGTANALDDYISILSAKLLTFTPGITTQFITVAVQGDTTTENDETFLVNLNNVINATFENDQGISTIRNDDFAPTLSINSVEVTEEDIAYFTVTLSNASAETVTVQYQTGDGTAIAGSDYIAIPLTLLTFSPGSITKTITVTTLNDTLDEDSETFFVNLTNPINATLGDMQGVGTISDDDKQILTYLPAILKNPTICTPYGPTNLILTNLNKTLTFRRIVDYANRYTIEVKVPANSDIEYGLSFGHLNTTPPMYYRFGIIDTRNSSPARFRLKWQKGREATQSDCLSPDGGDPCGFSNNTINSQSNHLRIECIADTVKLYLNGSPNPVWQRNLACDGGLGIFLQSEQRLGPVTGHFTDFRISCPINTNQLSSGGVSNAISTGSNSDLDH